MEWLKHYSRERKPGSFIIENRGDLGTKLRVIDHTLIERIYWIDVREGKIFGIRGAVPYYVREAVYVYFKSPQEFRRLLSECGPVPQTMGETDEPNICPDSQGMEDYTDEDLDKVEDKTKDTDLALREVPDKELENPKPKKESRTRPNLPLRLCNKCFKTFRSVIAECKCGSKDVELITPVREREHSDIVGDADFVFEVEFQIDGKKEKTRVTAFDEAGAKRNIERTKRGAKVLSVKKVSESKVNENVQDFDIYLNGKLIGTKGYDVINTSEPLRINWIKRDLIRNHGFSKGIEVKPTNGSKISEKHGDKNDVLSGGIADNRSEDEFDPDELAAGIKVELEHTNSEDLAKEIAMDHLAEDPKYYTHLGRMEAGKCDEPGDRTHEESFKENESKVNEEWAKPIPVDQIKGLFKSIDPAFATHLSGLVTNLRDAAKRGKEVGLELTKEGETALSESKVNEVASKRLDVTFMLEFPEMADIDKSGVLEYITKLINRASESFKSEGVKVLNHSITRVDESKVNEGKTWTYNKLMKMVDDGRARVNGWADDRYGVSADVTIYSKSGDRRENITITGAPKDKNESKVNEKFDAKEVVSNTITELVGEIASSLGILHSEALDVVKDNLPSESKMDELDAQASAGREERRAEVRSDESGMKEGKSPEDKDSEQTKIKKLTEGILELVGEIEGISLDDQKAIRRAVEEGRIQNEWPTDDQMIDELSSLEDVVDPSKLDEDVDLKMTYLKYVLVPKAISQVDEAKTDPMPKADSEKYFARELVKHLEKMGDSLTDEERTLLAKAKSEIEESKVDEGLFGGNYFIPSSGEGKRGEWDAIKDAVQKAVNSGLVKKASATDAGFSLRGVKDVSAINKLLPSGISLMREAKVNEQDELTILAKGVTDKAEADRIAREKKGQVVEDADEKGKFMVVTPKEE